MLAHPALLPLAHRMAGHAAAVLLTGTGSLAAIDFRNQIALGSIIVTVVILAIAGLFTIRSKIANVWREEAEGEKAAKERAHEELKEALRERADFERDQQELRHALKNDIAVRDLRIQALESKTDLEGALERIRQMNAELAGILGAQIADAMDAGARRSEERDHRTHALLEEIRDKLPSP